MAKEFQFAYSRVKKKSLHCASYQGGEQWALLSFFLSLLVIDVMCLRALRPLGAVGVAAQAVGKTVKPAPRMHKLICILVQQKSCHHATLRHTTVCAWVADDGYMMGSYVGGWGVCDGL